MQYIYIKTTFGAYLGIRQSICNHKIYDLIQINNLTVIDKLINYEKN